MNSNNLCFQQQTLRPYRSRFQAVAVLLHEVCARYIQAFHAQRRTTAPSATQSGPKSPFKQTTFVALDNDVPTFDGHNVGMPRSRLKRYLPSPHQVRENPALRPVAHLLAGSEIWHLNRRSAAGAVFIGPVLCFSTDSSADGYCSCVGHHHTLQPTHFSGSGVDIQPHHHSADLLLHLPPGRLVAGHADRGRFH